MREIWADYRNILKSQFARNITWHYVLISKPKRKYCVKLEDLGRVLEHRPALCLVKLVLRQGTLM